MHVLSSATNHFIQGNTMKLEQHQRHGMIAGMILALLALAILLLCGCGTTVTPLCRHIVLAHHAAAVDAGFEAETYRIKNPKPVNGFKFHAATRIRKPGGEWEWMAQPKTVWTTGPKPKGILLHRIK